MNCIVKVLSNYYVNKHIGTEGFEGEPTWVCQGEHIFILPVEGELIDGLDEEILENSIKRVLKDESSIGEDFRYIEYTIMSSSPTTVLGLEEYIQKEEEGVY